ncbi:thiamine pyrophosphate-dependent enzyme [Legionella santicrucis]|uniref:thiamine pyrophosphate-dependent enzyme n=1 Tax=Legionella santicrucis TaxID=45074 RepID=UPI002356A059|nr:thiamine pyrophosphate-dependent enzyme [Legionella santicrucis]
MKEAAQIINDAKSAIILAGAGVYRHKAEEALTHFVNHTKIPIATTFMGKGVVSSENPRMIGTIGFMRHDYVNFGFDDAYGLIQWKQELEFGHSNHVQFSNPDFVMYAESFGIKAHSIKSAKDLLPTLKSALASNEIVLIDCPVDYSENIKLTNKLGELNWAM